jgi:hypothetical protein
MTAQTWLPILTLALGWAGAQATEMYRHRTASGRERQARRDELQRNTLLELQDALLDASKLASQAQLEEFVATLPELDDRGRREADERIRRLTTASTKPAVGADSFSPACKTRRPVEPPHSSLPLPA